MTLVLVMLMAMILVLVMLMAVLLVLVMLMAVFLVSVIMSFARAVMAVNNKKKEERTRQLLFGVAEFFGKPRTRSQERKKKRRQLLTVRVRVHDPCDPCVRDRAPCHGGGPRHVRDRQCTVVSPTREEKGAFR